MVAGDCPTVVILVQPTYLDLHSHKDLGSNRPNNMHTVEENIWHLVFTTSTLAPVRNGKTRVASKTSKTTTAWWLVSNWSRMPLAMKRQINNEKNLIFPNSNLDRLGKTGTTSELHFFCNAQALLKTILNHGSWRLSHSCDSCAAVFAAKIWAQMG